MTIQSIMRSTMKHVSAPAVVGARSYTDLKASLAAGKHCDKNPELCACAERVEHGQAKKLLTVFRNLPATKPIQYVEVLKKWGGKSWMDQLRRELTISEGAQIVQCAKSWRTAQGRLEMPGEMLQVAMNHSVAKKANA